jgi:hypothetical protein
MLRLRTNAWLSFCAESLCWSTGRFVDGDVQVARVDVVGFGLCASSSDFGGVDDAGERRREELLDFDVECASNAIEYVDGDIGDGSLEIRYRLARDAGSLREFRAGLNVSSISDIIGLDCGCPSTARG